MANVSSLDISGFVLMFPAHRRLEELWSILFGWHMVNQCWALPDPGDSWGAAAGDTGLLVTAHKFSEAFSEAGGEQVVDDRVDRGAQVEKDPRDDMHVLEYFVHEVRPLRDEAPQQSVCVERSPADGKYHHYYTWENRRKKERH